MVGHGCWSCHTCVPGSRWEEGRRGTARLGGSPFITSRKSLHHCARDSLARAQSRGHRHPPEGLGTSEGIAALPKSGILWPKWGNQSSERLSNLSRVSLLVVGRMLVNPMLSKLHCWLRKEVDIFVPKGWVVGRHHSESGLRKTRVAWGPAMGVLWAAWHCGPRPACWPRSSTGIRGLRALAEQPLGTRTSSRLCSLLPEVRPAAYSPALSFACWCQ